MSQVTGSNLPERCIYSSAYKILQNYRLYRFHRVGKKFRKILLYKDSSVLFHEVTLIHLYSFKPWHCLHDIESYLTPLSDKFKSHHLTCFCILDKIILHDRQTSLKVFINTIFSKNYFDTSRIYKRLKVKFTFTKKLNITKGPNLTVFHGLIISSKPSSLSRCIKNENLKSLHVIFRNVSISAISSY